MTTLCRVGSLAVGILTLAAVSACAPATSGQPEPQTSIDASTASASPGAGSGDSIQNPKNLSSVSEACELLNEQQLKALGMTDADRSHADAVVGVPPCHWSGEKASIQVGPDSKSGGIQDFYQQFEGSGRIKKVTVDGYPAAHFDKTDVLCRVQVGVAKGEMIAVSYGANVGTNEKAPVDPCQQGEKIASMALKNIPDA